MNFSKGFLKLTLLTSDEWAGKLFVLLLVLYMDEGRDIFTGTIFSRDDIPMPRGWRGVPPLSLDEAAHGLDLFAAKLDAERENHLAEQKLSQVPRTARDEAKIFAEIEKGKKSKDDDPEEMLRPCSKADFTELAEALLCFHAWYKFGIPYLDSNGRLDTETIHSSVGKMLAMVRWYTPRKKGNGWKLQKFHDILHLAIDIERFGPPSNFDAGPHESGLCFWAKLPALTSQKRGYNIFARQVAARTHEFQCMARAMRAHRILGVRDIPLVKKMEEEKVEDEGKPKLLGTRYRVYSKQDCGGRAGNLGGFQSRWTTFPATKVFQKKKAKATFAVSPVVENYLRFQPKDDADVLPLVKVGGQLFWELRTEISAVLRDNPKRVTLRCHPNYKNEGPWYDWVIVNFEAEDEDVFEETAHSPQYDHNCVPCKVLAIARNPETDECKILVHGCGFRYKKEDRDSDTVLIEFWQLQYHDLQSELPKGIQNRNHDGSRTPHNNTYLAPLLTWVSLDNIVCRCLVVEEEPGVHEVLPTNKNGAPLNWVLLVRQRSQWPSNFTSV